MRILLVEDDNNLGHATAEGLRNPFAVDWVLSAEDADDAISTTKYDLIVLDVNLPKTSGIEFLTSLRKKKNDTPVLLLTARDAVKHKVEGLNAGADDYLVKPFDLDELTARCNALIRRNIKQTETVITSGNIIYEPATGRLEVGNKQVLLSGRERAIIDILFRNIGRTISKAQIEEHIYDWSQESIESNAIEVHVANIRKKLGASSIKTLRGVGYMVTK